MKCAYDCCQCYTVVWNKEKGKQELNQTLLTNRKSCLIYK